MTRIRFGLVLAILAASLVLNYVLFDRAQLYYVQLAELRLDPLGVRMYDAITPAADELHVVFYGDSRAYSWPVPAGFDGVSFINRGIGSQTTTQILHRFDVHVQPLQPQLVIVQAGINDLKSIPLLPEKRAEIVSATQANLRQIVERSREVGAAVILTTIFPAGDVTLARQFFWSDDVGVAVNEVNAYIKTLAADDVIIFDAFDLLADEQGKVRPGYAADTLHLNWAGYDRLNTELTKLLQHWIENDPIEGSL